MLAGSAETIIFPSKVVLELSWHSVSLSNWSCNGCHGNALFVAGIVVTVGLRWSNKTAGYLADEINLFFFVLSVFRIWD